jgi:predicted RecA/RadA family phage recombinase
VIIDNLFGVAAKTAAEGVEIATVGVYELPKLASAVIAAGAREFWLARPASAFTTP